MNISSSKRTRVLSDAIHFLENAGRRSELNVHNYFLCNSRKTPGNNLSYLYCYGLLSCFILLLPLLYFDTFSI